MMDRPKTIFEYLSQALMTFGFTIAIFIPLTLLLGNIAQEESSLFSLGSQGLSASSLSQLFLLSICVTLLRFLFFTEKIIRKASLVSRTVAMISSTVILIILFVVVFRWFPASLPIAWLSFGVSFLVCFVLSWLLSSYKEKLENKKMAEALIKMKNDIP